MPPLSPSSAPSAAAAASSPVTSVLRARVRNVTGRSREEGQTQAAGREHGCRPPSPRGGEDRAGEGRGKGERRVKGRPGARRGKPRALGPPGAAAATAGTREGGPPAREPLTPRQPTPAPAPGSLHRHLHSPQPLCCRELTDPQILSKRNLAEPRHSTATGIPRLPTGLGGRKGGPSPPGPPPPVSTPESPTPQFPTPSSTPSPSGA